MDLRTVKKNINLNLNKIEQASYTSRLDYHYDKPFNAVASPVQDTLSQITSNLEYVYKRFDHTGIPQSLELIKKSFVMGFEYEFSPKSLKQEQVWLEVQKRKPEAKAKLLYIINSLWKYRLAAHL